MGNIAEMVRKKRVKGERSPVWSLTEKGRAMLDARAEETKP